jgi:hypothetical protein
MRRSPGRDSTNERRNAPSALDGVRNTHRALLERMRAEDGKGQKHRVVPLPARLEDRLRKQLREVRALPEQHLAQGSSDAFCHCVLGKSLTRTGIAGRIG